MTNNPPTLAWDTTTPPHYFINGVDSGTCTFSIGGVSNSRLRCISSNTTIPAGQTITFTGTLNNVGFGFWRPHNINVSTEFSVRNSGGVNVLPSSMFDNISITNTLNANGSATITFSARGKAGGSTVQRIQFRDILPYASPTLPLWLFSVVSGGGVTCVASNDNCNNWHQLTYYAFSPGYAPGGPNTCNPLPGTPSCLTVTGSGGGNNKRAVVVMTSAALVGHAHPSGTLTDYLEGENATPADFIYENKARSSTFNDQAIIVAP